MRTGRESFKLGLVLPGKPIVKSIACRLDSNGVKNEGGILSLAMLKSNEKFVRANWSSRPIRRKSFRLTPNGTR